MGIHEYLPQELHEVDVVIVGGGTAGCVIASRLADSDVELSILIIESGPDNYQKPDVVHPALFLGNLSPASDKNSVYMGTPSAHVANRSLPVIVGNVLGGGTSINTMAYARGQASDYDSWNMPGWSTDDLRPYLSKFETYYGAGSGNLHGDSGPVVVSEGSHGCNKVRDDLLEVAKEAGLSEKADLQSIQHDAVNGIQKSLCYISKDGKRQDAAHSYLHPRLRDGKHQNLHVLLKNQVTQILFERKTAVGVLYQPSADFGPSTHTRQMKIKARRLVVSCAGALGSPTLLERSGVGEGDFLRRLGVDVVENLPGVGNGYQDHQAMNYAYLTNLGPGETLDSVVFGHQDIAELIESMAPVLGHNGQELGLKLRPTAEEIAQLGADFQKAWSIDFQNQPDKPLALMALISCFPGYDPNLPPGQYIGMSTFLGYPLSRGQIHISGTDPSDPVNFDAGFLNDAEQTDIKAHIWAYKKQRELMRRMKCCRGEYAPWHPAFNDTSKAACGDTPDSMPADTPSIEYTAEDDAKIAEFIRENVGSLWHSMGTCKMASRSLKGVVDERLNVHGLDGLKVADLSIVPSNIGANTASTAYAIGEKAADMLIAELAAQ